MKGDVALERICGLSLACFFIIVGIVLIVGSVKKWVWLVDPPHEYWLVYSHSFIKKVFGKTVLLYFNYILGIALISLSLLGVWRAVK
jgi:small neutral amino acid transporter SnatA (MarC family)